MRRERRRGKEGEGEVRERGKRGKEGEGEVVGMLTANILWTYLPVSSELCHCREVQAWC